ncbi:hypothetical protein [Sulfobacillus harzensis]|uniref:hypothetical protein n=1 Tax=Sulfobacillus harzensis TaxID=2729629 RepID=UPI001A9AADFF|nr:hypothetical protein [Sulfobacillus harzensis]
MQDNRRIWIAGIIGTALFALVMDLIPSLHGPKLNIALWDGTFVTLNLSVAIIVGYVLEFLIGVGMAALYHKYWSFGPANPVIRGILFGLAVWLAFMAIGVPIFDRISPLVQNGLLLGPGAFLWRMGIMAPITWLVASLVYGSSVSYVIERTPSLSER